MGMGQIKFETKGGLKVSTIEQDDSMDPYETAVKHPEYNDGDWIIVEMYETKDRAIIGHDKWVDKMTSDPLPDELPENGTSIIGIMCRALGEASHKRKDLL